MSKGFSILDSETELLLCLERSLDALDKEIIKECFLDLGSFPEDQRIPAAALIDIWAELYDVDTDIECIANIYELTKRSLANLVVTRCACFIFSCMIFSLDFPPYIHDRLMLITCYCNMLVEEISSKKISFDHHQEGQDGGGLVL